MNGIFGLYNQFLGYFPTSVHPLISFFLAILLVYGIIKVIQKDFIYIILLVILLPASIPILKNIWDALLNIVRFLLGQK